MKKYFFTIVATAILLASCGSNDAQYDATGNFEATEVTVSAEQNGRLLVLNADEGTLLKQGQEAAVIDTVQLYLKAKQLGATRNAYASQRPDVQKQIADLRQQLTKAVQDRERYAALVKDGAANRKLLDDAVSHENVLRRQLQARLSTLGNSTQSLTNQMSATDIQRLQVLDQLEKCHIKAPISGIVLEKYAEQGEFATVGKPLFKMADTERMFLRAYVTTAQLQRVKVGQQVKVFADYGSNNRKEYQGTVSWISQHSEFTPKTVLTDDERADLVYAVKVAVHNDGYLKIGMYGEVKF